MALHELVELHERSWSCTSARGVARALVELHERSWSCTSARGVARALVELHERSWSCTSARGVHERSCNSTSSSRAFKQKKLIKIGPLLRKL